MRPLSSEVLKSQPRMHLDQARVYSTGCQHSGTCDCHYRIRKSCAAAVSVVLFLESHRRRSAHVHKCGLKTLSAPYVHAIR